MCVVEVATKSRWWRRIRVSIEDVLFNALNKCMEKMLNVQNKCRQKTFNVQNEGDVSSPSKASHAE